jgi:hypothetical protein
VVEQALETVPLMLGSDKPRGYCLEMICADFLAGSGTKENQLEVLVLSLERLYQTLPDEGRQQLLNRLREGRGKLRQKRPRFALSCGEYNRLRISVLERDRWKCQCCGSSINLKSTISGIAGAWGSAALDNLISLCAIAILLRSIVTLADAQTNLAGLTGVDPAKFVSEVLHRSVSWQRFEMQSLRFSSDQGT